MTRYRWVPVQVHCYGITLDRQMLAIRCLWHGALGGQLVQVVLSRPVGAPDGYQLALVTTDLAATPAMIIERYADPEALRAMFGLEDFTSGTGFLTAELFSLVVPLVMLTLGISFGARATAGEEERKTVDLLLANPLPRRRLVTDNLLALAAALAVVGLVLAVVLWAGATMLDMGVGLGGIAAATGSAALLGLAFGTIALAVGCATGRRALAAAVTAALALAGWLVDSLAPLVEALEPWRRLSLFYQYLEHDPLRNGFDPANAGVLVAVAAVMALVATVAFQRRDLAT